MNRSAFTLIEVVVALALGAILLLGVQGLAVSGYRAAGAADRRYQANPAELPAMLFRADLASRPLGGGIALSDDALVIDTLNSLRPHRAAARQRVEVRYRIDTDDGDGRLLRGERSDSDAPFRETPLMRGVRGADFSVHDGQSWHSRWPLETPRPARALRVQLESSDGSEHTAIVALQPLTWSRHDE